MIPAPVGIGGIDSAQVGEVTGIRSSSGAALTLAGLYDLAQPLHSVRRNYPLIGRLRWLFEEIRPEIRQYLIEDDHEQTPFSRSQRSLVYPRANNESSERAFGTLVDVYDEGYEFIAHSVQPAPSADPARSGQRQVVPSSGASPSTR